MRIIVVGGGIGGLTCALALNRIGIDVRGYESVSALRPLGVGINLLPNAVRVLDALGLVDEFLAFGIQTRDFYYYNRHGQLILREPRGIEAGYRLPQISIHRGEAQLILLRAAIDRLGEGNVRTGHHFQEFRQSDGGQVTAVFADCAAGGLHITDTADALIGADGIHSAVRGRCIRRKARRSGRDSSSGGVQRRPPRSCRDDR